ncbi:hypothetical protein F5Y06DRAFT_299535 [Hypoxylon sp. FL0890]|nr:hypothetical protein F5Y06DRAFT_299535 [Hypoxylon sp. FL0890]
MSPFSEADANTSEVVFPIDYFFYMPFIYDHAYFIPFIHFGIDPCFTYWVKAAATACLWVFSVQGSTTTTTASSPTTSGSVILTPTFNTISSTSATSPSGTSSSNIPGVTNLPGASIILSIVPMRDAKDAKRVQHTLEPDSIFIDTTRPPTPNPNSCTSASPFNLTAGRLSSNGHFLSTHRAVLYQPLGTSSSRTNSISTPITTSTTISISTSFSIVDGLLRWYNEEFYRGRARYCRVRESGTVYVVFHTEKTWPVGCEEVDVAVFLVERCRGGRIVPGRLIGQGLAGVAVTTAVGGTRTDMGTGMGVGTVGSVVGGGATATSGMGSWDEL